MRSLYFQLISGAGGDMILASLIDLGVPLSYLRESFAKLTVEGLRIDTEKTTRSGITCLRLKPAWSEQKSFRHLPDILSLIREGGFSARVVQNCEKVLMRIARAEAKVHGIALEKVHFHEIGAVDTIIDVLGACLALEYLGVQAVYFSTLTVGRGMIECAHGNMPVPVPATAEMIQGFSTKTLDIDTEILTPTGCAILTALGTQLLCGPRGTAAGVGYATGDKEFGRQPNILRTVLLESADNEESADNQEKVTVIESDMDHISGEVMAFTAEELLGGGALDVSWVSIYMKKGRPGYRLTVICAEEKRRELTQCIFRNTHTLGVRYSECSRIVVPRSQNEARLRGEKIITKNYEIDGRRFSKVEYESLATVARKLDVPLIDLYDEYVGETNAPE